MARKNKPSLKCRHEAVARPATFSYRRIASWGSTPELGFVVYSSSMAARYAQSRKRISDTEICKTLTNRENRAGSLEFINFLDQAEPRCQGKKKNRARAI
jgi:hypothetical protein